MMIHDDITTVKINVQAMWKSDLMQQSMMQFLATFGIYNLNIKCGEGVHIFHWL